MKTTIIYEFDDNDEYKDNQIMRLTNHTRSYLALYDISTYLYLLLEQDQSEGVYDCITSIKEKLYEIMEDNHISLDDLE